MHNFMIALHALLPLIAAMVIIGLLAVIVAVVTGQTHDGDGMIEEATCWHVWRKLVWWPGLRTKSPHPQMACEPCRDLWMSKRPR